MQHVQFCQQSLYKADINKRVDFIELKSVSQIEYDNNCKAIMIVYSLNLHDEQFLLYPIIISQFAKVNLICTDIKPNLKVNKSFPHQQTGSTPSFAALIRFV